MDPPSIFHKYSLRFQVWDSFREALDVRTKYTGPVDPAHLAREALRAEQVTNNIFLVLRMRGRVRFLVQMLRGLVNCPGCSTRHAAHAGPFLLRRLRLKSIAMDKIFDSQLIGKSEPPLRAPPTSHAMGRRAG